MALSRDYLAQGEPTLVVIDEADIDIQQDFVLPHDALSRRAPFTRVVFCVPDLPPDYHQLPSLRYWHSQRIRELEAYVAKENARDVNECVHFSVACGKVSAVRKRVLSAKMFNATSLGVPSSTQPISA